MRACPSHQRASWHPSMLKWAVVGWTQYDWVAFADSDVGLMAVDGHPDAVAARWAAMAPAAAAAAGGGVAAHVRLIASADHESPVNAGLMLLRPSRAVYRDGLGVMARCRFNGSHGWELLGPPRTCCMLRPIFADGQRLPSVPARGCVDDLGCSNDPRTSAAHVRDRHDYIGADIDQGFFWHMFYVRHDAGAYFRYHTTKHKALHWWGQGKRRLYGPPWAPCLVPCLTCAHDVWQRGSGCRPATVACATGGASLGAGSWAAHTHTWCTRGCDVTRWATARASCGAHGGRSSATRALARSGRRRLDRSSQYGDDDRDREFPVRLHSGFSPKNSPWRLSHDSCESRRRHERDHIETRTGPEHPKRGKIGHTNHTQRANRNARAPVCSPLVNSANVYEEIAAYTAPAWRRMKPPSLPL